jgi:sensor c-di-GMP phosphodiesterase-like protein
MGLTAVAEGIEHGEQVERLIQAGCQLGQGHHFAPALEPTPAIAYAAWQPAGGRSRKRRRAA